MLIPSIDLQGGRIVQLEQGERLVYASNDVDGWLARFARAPVVQVIDLDAAMDRGHNRQLVRRICRERACQVGGGIRTVDQAREVVASGARRIILGSALYAGNDADVRRAAVVADALGPETIVAAVDARAGHVVTRGWRKALALTPVEAVRRLEPFAGAFLYTHVDGEGLLGGLDLTSVSRVHRATSRALMAAGGIRDHREVDALDALGIDAVVGMAIYRGLMTVD
jgi:phosphoribosylformimino-5-aminoimidazole carboxamide ribotide isomerase